MLFLIKVTPSLPVSIIDFAEDFTTAYEMILNICNKDNVLSVIDNLDLLETQDGIHLLKVNKNEYVKIIVKTLGGYLYDSKDFERVETYFITSYSPVKEKKI